MDTRKNWITGILFAAIFSAAMMMNSYAAEGVISSVTIRVESAIQPGDKLPSINIYNAGEESSVSDGDIGISTTADKYYISDAQWVTSSSRTMEVGYEPELKLWLSPAGGSGDNYYFRGTYRSSNVTIKSGTFVSATVSGNQLVVRLKTRPIKGTFGAPSDAYWKDNTRGTAKWTKPDGDGTGSYEVVLRRGSSTVHKIETSNTSYNFYPYMTSAGTYNFRVRTIAKTNKESQYGTRSEWVESEELYIAKEDVSDGSGRNDGNSTSGSSGPNGNMKVGWQLMSGYWYYYYPDGSYQKNSWLNVGGKWYLFQEDGKMLRGWQNKGNYTYFLTESGDMYTGWLQSGNRWYYMSTAQDSTIGALVKNSWVVLDGKAYFMTADGSMAEGWYQVNGSWYYFYPGAGHKAVNTYIDSFFVDVNGVWVR